MWQNLLERLTKANKAQSNIFWPDLDREKEIAMLNRLFITAIARDVLTDDQAEQFLSEVCVINSCAECNTPETISRLTSSDLNTVTRNLLNMDEMLSPISLMLFGRKLLQDHEREMLRQDIETVQGTTVCVS